jgi:hypothetical protein
MADNKQYTIQLNIDSTGAVTSINKVNEGLEKTEKTAGDIKKSADKSAGGFKAMGTAIKASGIGLLVAAFAFLKDVISSNQKVLDVITASLGTFADIIRDAFGYITENGGKVVEWFKAIFDDPVQSLKDFGDAIVDNLIERFNSFLDTLGFIAEGVKNLFSGDFTAALESFKNAGKESVDVLTGVDDSVNKVSDAVSSGIDALVEYTTKTYEANMALVQLQNNAKLAAAQQARLAEQFDRQAELLRQQRDDETRSIADRIKSNDALLEVLKKQETAELAAANAQVAAAQATFQHSQTIDNQVALTGALANADGVRAKIAGLMSEQQMNAMALTREYNELLKAQAASTADLNIASAKFAADSIKNDIERLNAQRAVLEEEKVIQLERLQSEIEKYKEGTQARLDAEIAFNTKKQEIDQALASNATALSEAEIARANDLNVLRAQNDLTGFDERRALLELEYAEKERLAFGDAAKIEQIEREKQEKIRQLNLETFQANLELAQQGITALQGVADAAFSNKQNELDAAAEAEVAALEKSFESQLASVEKGSEAEKALIETAQKNKEALLLKNAKKAEEVARKQFEFNKKLQLGGAIIDAAKAITASLSQSPVAIGPIPNPAGIASLAVATATGIANVAKIRATKFESTTPPASSIPSGGGGGGGGGDVGGGGGAPTGTQAPSFNALNLDFLNNRPNQPIEAYVIAGDVANGLEARDKVADLARLG